MIFLNMCPLGCRGLYYGTLSASIALRFTQLLHSHEVTTARHYSGFKRGDRASSQVATRMPLASSTAASSSGPWTTPDDYPPGYQVVLDIGPVVTVRRAQLSPLPIQAPPGLTRAILLAERLHKIVANLSRQLLPTFSVQVIPTDSILTEPCVRVTQPLVQPSGKRIVGINP